jgi:competence protein ComEC
VSIAAQVIIFPLSALYFHQFPVYFLISNLFVVIPAALIMYAGIFYLLLPQLPLVSASLAFVLEKTIILLNKGLAYVENAPFSTIGKIWLTTPEYLLLYAVIISLFYFLYDKKVWLLQLSMTCALLFCLSISIKRIQRSNAKEIAWLNLKKHTGIIFKNGDEAIVLTDLKATDKTFQYSIQPYLDSCKVNIVSVYGLNQDINTEWLRKKSGLVQFLHTTLFVFDKGFFSDDLSEKVKTNYIYITGNPDTGLKSINRSFDYHSLVIDGSNSDKKIKLWAKQLADEHINFTILKRNKSLISVSN